MSGQAERLWTAEDLAAYLGMSPRTIAAMASRAPDRLPPRVRAVRALRWEPGVCVDWAKGQSEPAKRKAGRPRKLA